MSKIIKFDNLVAPAVHFLVISAFILLVGKTDWWPSFYYPKYFSIIFFTSAFLIMLPKYIFKAKNSCQAGSIVLIRTTLAIAFILNAAGELYFYQLYKYGIQYDKIIHFIIPFLFLVTLTSFFESWRNYSIKRSLRYSVIIIVFGSILWEAFEFFSDLIFKTSEFGVYGQYKFSDTFLDILFDLAGIIAGLYILSKPKLSERIINDYCHRPLLTGRESGSEK